MSRENHLKPHGVATKSSYALKTSSTTPRQERPDLDEVNERQEASEAVNLIPQSRFVRSYQRVPKAETNADVTVNIRSGQAPKDEL